LVSAHTPILLAVPVGFPVSEPSPAIVDRKYSVPLACGDACPRGDCAGHTVKPGVPGSCRFSTRVMRTLGPWAASSCLENEKTWAALNPDPNRSYSLVEM
jgi:hypothetical protein